MLTIIFSSHNGEHSLQRMLEAYCNLEIPKDGWKIVAVDNRSTDRTLAILKSYQDRLPLLPLTQPKLGKNSAINMALAHIDGDYVVFTDDDVLPATDWLTRLLQVAEQRPDYDIFGGAIIPEWPRLPPQWMVDHIPLGPAFVVTPPTRQEGPLRPSAVWGPNMMIRAKLFKEGIRFDETIGPGLGPDYPMGSETELTERLVNQGHRCWFTPEAQVKHIIRENQMRLSWVLRRAMRSGKGEAAKRIKTQSAWQRKKLVGAPRWLYRELANNAWKTLRAGALVGRPTCLRPLWQFCHTLGQINYYRHTEYIKD